MIATEVLRCRACTAPLPAAFLDLGSTPVANRLLHDEAQSEERYPLAVALCSGCLLVQLAWELPADALFDADYPYFSSFSDTVVASARAHVDALVEELGLGAHSFVVEIASNDGYLLEALLERGVKVLGVEPTAGPAAAARARGVPTVQAFFGRQLAADIVREHGRADVVIANNVMAHVPDLDDFVGGLADLRSPAGVLTVENPSLGELLEHVEFDTIYHEHYCYFSCLSVRALFAQHGLTLTRVQDLPLHGGSLRWWAAGGTDIEASVATHLADECRAGLDTAQAYEGFGQRVTLLQSRLRALLEGLREEGCSVAAYGAAAKGATLLNTTGIGRDLVDFVVDRNVHKQGLLMPGARLPIRAPEVLLDEQPDHVLLLAWNMESEVFVQQAEYVRRGGCFIVPVPDPVVRPAPH